MQNDLDIWLSEYNEQRPHSGKYCFGRTPMQTFLDSIPLAKEKLLNLSADRQDLSGQTENQKTAVSG